MITGITLRLLKTGRCFILYIDGVLDGSTNDTTTGTTQNNSSLYLGRRGATTPSIDGFWSGSLDEVRIWNIARSGAEISADMNVNLSGAESGLVLYYDFNQACLLYTSPSPRDQRGSRMPSSA